MQYVFTSQRPIITLTDEEAEWCRDIGARRHQQARKAHVQDRQMGPQDPMFIDINGLGGELAFCKACGIELVDALGVRSKGHDATVVGLRFDVKTTHYKNGELRVHREKTLQDADCYALMRGTLPTYELAGWCWADEVIHERNLDDGGHGYGYIVSGNHLRPFYGKGYKKHGVTMQMLIDIERWQKTRGAA